MSVKFDNEKPDEGGKMSRGNRRYMIFLLMTIYALNFLDRNIFNVLVEPIKNDFRLLDWQVGAMAGIGFALFYCTLGIPIARYAEYAHRPRIIAVAIAIWSVCTALCGLATSFTQLLLARMGVGIGEAGCTPPAHSLISDYVPRHRRAAALALYQLGNPIGAMVGIVIGGIIAGFYGWRTAFLLAGLPGLILAVLAACTLWEPRSSVLASPATPGREHNIRQALACLRRKRSFWWTCWGAGVKAIAGYGLAVFITSFFLRNFRADLQAIEREYALDALGAVAIAIGVVGGFAGMLGTYGSGLVTDRLARSNPRGYTTMPAIGSLLLVPLIGGMVFAETLPIALIFFGLQALCAAVWAGPVFAICQSVVPVNMRATSSAIQLFIGNMTGLLLGPVLIGVLSDLMAESIGDAESLKWAIFFSSFFGVLASGCFMMARKYISDEYEG